MRGGWAIALAFGACLAGAAQVRMDPGEYLERAKAAADIARVVASYNGYVEAQDPILFMHGDANMTSAGARLPSSVGELDGDFIGFDATMYARILKTKDVSLRALFLVSLFDFRMDDASLARNPWFGDSHEQWGSGYGLFGLQGARGEDRLTLGGVLRYEPYIKDEGAGLVFSHYLDAEGDGRSNTLVFERLYADGRIGGWSFDGQLSLAAVERLAAERLFAVAGRELGVGPVLQYLGRMGSLRPGFRLRWDPLPWLSARVGATAAIGKGGLGLGEATVDLGMPFVLLRNRKMQGRDLTLRADLRGSLYGAGEGRIVPGGKAELSVDNIRSISYAELFGKKTYMGAGMGVSYNHADTLARMPFEGQVLIYMRLWGGYY